MKYNWIESMFPTTAVCYVSISRTITQEEWEKVYEETLSLACDLDLCSVEDIDFHGFTAKCFARPKEIKENYFGPVQYWNADGLYSERVGVAPVKFFRKLNDDECGQPKGSAFLGYAYDDESLSFSILGQQLEVPHYISSILALAFLIEARLPDKAFVYGDFDYPLAVEAVEKINKHLKDKIGLPIICRPEALMALIKETDCSEKEKLELFKNTCIKQTAQKKEAVTREYDVECTAELFKYKKGNSIAPELLKLLKETFDMLAAAKKQNGYKILSTIPPAGQIKRLAWHAGFVPICDVDWKHIIDNFESRKDSLERYYPLFMIRCESYSSSSNIIRSLLINDDLYEFCKEQGFMS